MNEIKFSPYQSKRLMESLASFIEMVDEVNQAGALIGVPTLGQQFALEAGTFIGVLASIKTHPGRKSPYERTD